MSDDLSGDHPTFMANEPAASQANVPALAGAEEEPVETSLLELSALLLVVLAGIALTFTGGIVALTLGSGGS